MHTRIIITFIPLNYLLKGTLSELSPPKRKSLSSPMGVRVCQERSRGFSPLILILGQTKKQKTPKIFKQCWKLISIWQENFSLSKNHLWFFSPVKSQIKYSNKLQLIEIKLDESWGATGSSCQEKLFKMTQGLWLCLWSKSYHLFNWMLPRVWNKYY